MFTRDIWTSTDSRYSWVHLKTYCFLVTAHCTSSTRIFKILQCFVFQSYWGMLKRDTSLFVDLTTEWVPLSSIELLSLESSVELVQRAITSILVGRRCKSWRAVRDLCVIVWGNVLNYCKSCLRETGSEVIQTSSF